MDWKGVKSPYLGLLIGLILVTTLQAQPIDPCIQGGNINIEFPESTPDNPPSDIQTITNKDTTYQIIVNQEPDDLNPLFKFSDYFQVLYNSVSRDYYVTMIKGIDRDGPTPDITDDTNVLQYQLICRHAPGPDVYSVLKILITDVNDNSPVFNRPFYSTSISELTPVGKFFYQEIYATDLDEAENKQINYFLSDTVGAMFPSNNTFVIPVSGESVVELAKVLDFESMYRQTGNRADLCYYNLTVTAADKGQPPRSATTSLIVLITDDDDLGPQFDYPSCIPSTEQHGQSCIRAKYLTNLQPRNSQTLVFYPYPADPNNPNATVDIIAEDRDTLNAPIICQIAQTLPVGYKQYFSVQSQQIGTTKQYRCVVTYNPGNSPINRTFIQSLDIILEVIENSVNRRLETATITVNLVQSNTGPPVISPQTATGYMYENSATGTLVSQDINTTVALRLTISDPDLSPTDPVPPYKISVSDSMFTVTPTGYIQLQTNGLDYKTRPLYVLTVIVTDPKNTGDTATATVTVSVLNQINECPQVVDKYYVTAEEGNYAQSPRQLLVVTANESDFGPVTFTKLSVSPAGSDSKFTVASTGAISLQGSVVANEVYFINIRGSNNGSPQRRTDTVVVVKVTSRGNQVPAFSACRYIIYISKDAPVNTPLFLLQAIDPDTDPSKLVYAIVSEVPSTNSFRIINNTLTNTKMFDREATAEYNVSVRVSDPQGNSGITVFTIALLVTDDQDPVFYYPSCISSTEPYGPSCISARYLSNLQFGKSQTLVFSPYPADTNNPNGTVDIIAQDRNKLNSSIIFQIAKTIPIGLESYFTAKSERIGQTKQYRCIITYNPEDKFPLPSCVSQVEIILQAIEDTVNRRQEEAIISVTLK